MYMLLCASSFKNFSHLLPRLLIWAHLTWKLKWVFVITVVCPFGSHSFPRGDNISKIAKILWRQLKSSTEPLGQFLQFCMFIIKLILYFINSLSVSCRQNYYGKGLKFYFLCDFCLFFVMRVICDVYFWFTFILFKCDQYMYQWFSSISGFLTVRRYDNSFPFISNPFIFISFTNTMSPYKKNIPSEFFFVINH